VLTKVHTVLTMSALVLRCQSGQGRVVLQGLTTDSTLDQLQVIIETSTGIAKHHQKIKTGFPPKPLALDDTSATLTTLGLRSGDTLVVEKSENTAPQIQQGVGGISKGIKRKVVPANNSCLFASVGHNLQGDSGESITKALRYLVGNLIISSPNDYPEAVLGKEPAEYAKWIQGAHVWGGGIEISVLAKHFNTEIHVVDTQTLRIDKFGQDLQADKKTYVIYDGIHYDPLYSDSSAGPVCVFDKADQGIEDAAMVLAHNANKAHNYTDLANFTLKCGTCQTGLKGEGDARKHAKETGHTNFQEFS